MATEPEREKALEDYKNSLLQSREWEAKLKALRQEIKGLQRDYDVSEENIKALQSVGQIIGEVLKQLDEERCKPWMTLRILMDSILTSCDVQLSSKHHQARAMSWDADRKLTRSSSSKAHVWPSI